MVHSSFCLVFSSLFRFIIIQRTCHSSVPPLYRPPQAKTAPQSLRFIPPFRKEPRIPWYNLRLCRRDTEKAQISYASSLYLCTAFLARENLGCNRTVTFWQIFKGNKNMSFHWYINVFKSFPKRVSYKNLTNFLHVDFIAYRKIH